MGFTFTVLYVLSKVGYGCCNNTSDNASREQKGGNGVNAPTLTFWGNKWLKDRFLPSKYDFEVKLRIIIIE